MGLSKQLQTSFYWMHTIHSIKDFITALENLQSTGSEDSELIFNYFQTIASDGTIPFTSKNCSLQLER